MNNLKKYEEKIRQISFCSEQNQYLINTVVNDMKNNKVYFIGYDIKIIEENNDFILMEIAKLISEIDEQKSILDSIKSI